MLTMGEWYTVAGEESPTSFDDVGEDTLVILTVKQTDAKPEGLLLDRFVRDADTPHLLWAHEFGTQAWIGLWFMQNRWRVCRGLTPPDRYEFAPQADRAFSTRFDLPVLNWLLGLAFVAMIVISLMSSAGRATILAFGSLMPLVMAFINLAVWFRNIRKSSEPEWKHLVIGGGAFAAFSGVVFCITAMAVRGS